MGNEIGYVSNVRIINNNEVFVSFVITKPGIEIPEGSKANIELTGLVGSRSLELYPPEKGDAPTLAIVQPLNADRLSGAYSDSTTVAEIIYKATNGLNKMILVEELPLIRNLIIEKSNDILDIPAQIDSINEIQDNIIKEVKDNKKLKDFREKVEKTAR